LGGHGEQLPDVIFFNDVFIPQHVLDPFIWHLLIVPELHVPLHNVQLLDPKLIEYVPDSQL